MEYALLVLAAVGVSALVWSVVTFEGRMKRTLDLHQDFLAQLGGEVLRAYGELTAAPDGPRIFMRDEKPRVYVDPPKPPTVLLDDEEADVLGV